MPLECTIVALDTSEWMRNGDYTPTRFLAQNDAASAVCRAKLQSNPESTVGVLTHGGLSPSLITSPSTSSGEILKSMRDMEMGGVAHFGSAVSMAMLALKHRRNKHGGQRIIIFVGSPIKETEAELRKLGGAMKKNNIAIDVISMGENESNKDKLTAMVNKANKEDNSHLITVPAGVIPIDILRASPIFGGGGGGGGAGGGPAGFMEYGGINPDDDPELAMALRDSMIDHAAHDIEAADGTGGIAAPAGEDDAEAALLAEALRLSMLPEGEGADSAEAEAAPEPEAAPSGPAPATPAPTAEPTVAPGAPGPSTTETPAAAGDAEVGREFFESLLGSVEGVDMGDEGIQSLLSDLGAKGDTDDKDGKKDGEGDKKK